MSGSPRAALFADSLLEVNGVARTCGKLEWHARQHGLPLLVVHPGSATSLEREGDNARLSLACSRLRLNLENDLKFDLLFMRHLGLVLRCLREFRAEIVHLTGPNHTGFLGSLAAWRLGLPVVMSWHTNVHDYASWRLPGFVPARVREAVRKASFRALALYYRQARVILAPNRDIAAQLGRATGKPVRLMLRGVDCELFRPERKNRADGAFVAGYVGRLSPEKAVRRLRDVSLELQKAGLRDYRIEVVGDGAEREWLERNVPNLVCRGVLHGEELAQAYANFDVFVFPSETDTFGNVVLEAMASGVPCVVMDAGGPATLVQHGVTGLVCRSAAELAAGVAELARRPAMRQWMSGAARRAALGRTWDEVGATVWTAWQDALIALKTLPAGARCLA